MQSERNYTNTFTTVRCPPVPQAQHDIFIVIRRNYLYFVTLYLMNNILSDYRFKVVNGDP